MLTKKQAAERVSDTLRRLHPSISKAAQALIVERLSATEHQVMLDSDYADGLLLSLIDSDRHKNQADYRPVPTPTELLDAEVARLKELTGDEVSPEEKIVLHRRFGGMNEEARLAASEELGLKPLGAAPVAVDTPAPKTARKRVIDMTEAEVEAEITLRWGPPPPTGRLGSQYHKYRDALIEAERSGPSEADVREVETAKFLETQRALSPSERIRAHRAAQRASA